MSLHSRWARGIALAFAIAFTSQAATAQTIRMWTFLNPGGKADREIALKKLIEGFEAANPNLKILVEPQDYRTLADKFFAAHQTGTAPDVIWVYSSRLFDAIKLGALANLDEVFIKNWSKADIDDFDGPIWRYAATPTAHYQIMHSRTVYGTLYRTDWLKDAGVDPASLSTWDKFIPAAQKLVVKDEMGKVTRWGYGQALAGQIPQPPITFNMLMQKNESIFDKNFRANWAVPAGVDALKLQADMIRKYGITPETAISTIEDDMYDQFSSGRFAITRGGTARMSTLINKIGVGKVGYTHTPSVAEGTHPPAVVSGWCVAIWSGSKQKDLAGKWVEYMSSRVGDTIWSTVGGQVPIRKSTITDNPVFFGDPKNAHYSFIAAEMRDYGWLPPEGAGPGGWNEGLVGAIQDVLVNNTDPKVALQKTEANFNRANKR